MTIDDHVREPFSIDGHGARTAWKVVRIMCKKRGRRPISKHLAMATLAKIPKYYAFHFSDDAEKEAIVVGDSLAAIVAEIRSRNPSQRFQFREISTSEYQSLRCDNAVES
jgi:hypothetical protein